MTYCLAMNLRDGMVFVSDSRTNAGVDTVCRFEKMHVFGSSGDRLIVILTAGNLSITQKAMNLLLERPQEDPASPGIASAHTMFEVASLCGAAMRRAQREDGDYLAQKGLHAGASLIVGGQIAGERPRLFLVYPEGNFIESSQETERFQIGEMKYGRPVLDQLLAHDTPLGDAVKCALLSFQATIRSNLSVGPPLHVLVYRADDLDGPLPTPVQVDADDPYFVELDARWDRELRRLFARLPNPIWTARAASGKQPARGAVKARRTRR